MDKSGRGPTGMQSATVVTKLPFEYRVTELGAAHGWHAVLAAVERTFVEVYDNGRGRYLAKTKKRRLEERHEAEIIIGLFGDMIGRTAPFVDMEAMKELANQGRIVATGSVPMFSAHDKDKEASL